MKIESVTAEILRFDLERPMADAQIDIGARIIVLVRVRTSSGIEGVGEAGAFGGAEQTVKTIIETQLAPLLVRLLVLLPRFFLQPGLARISAPRSCYDDRGL